MPNNERFQLTREPVRQIQTILHNQAQPLSLFVLNNATEEPFQRPGLLKKARELPGMENLAETTFTGHCTALFKDQTLLLLRRGLYARASLGTAALEALGQYSRTVNNALISYRVGILRSAGLVKQADQAAESWEAIKDQFHYTKTLRRVMLMHSSPKELEVLLSIPDFGSKPATVKAIQDFLRTQRKAIVSNATLSRTLTKLYGEHLIDDPALASYRVTQLGHDSLSAYNQFQEKLAPFIPA